jgi:hypothetical protein
MNSEVKKLKAKMISNKSSYVNVINFTAFHFVIPILFRILTEMMGESFSPHFRLKRNIL